MATSGSVNFSQDAESIVRDVLYASNSLSPGEDLEEHLSQMTIRCLNRMFKALQSTGVLIWTYQEAYLFPNLTDNDYTIGEAGTAHFTDSAVITTLTAAAASSATTLSLVSTGITVGDYVGIELTAGTRQWTTIATIPGATSITITDALTSAAASGNNVFTYTTKSKYPISIPSVRYYDYSAALERPLQEDERSNYYDTPDKSISATTNMYFYDAGNQQTGTLNIFPLPDDIADYMKVTYERQIQDIDSLSDSIDFPSQWYNAIIYMAAVDLSPFLRIKADDDLRERAEYYYNKALRTNVELDTKRTVVRG